MASDLLLPLNLREILTDELIRWQSLPNRGEKAEKAPRWEAKMQKMLPPPGF
jgi:hypothetical protein